MLGLRERKLITSDLAAGDKLGESVAMNSDGSTVAVGAINNDGTGAVYIFSQENSIWNERAKLVAASAEVGETFGSSLTMDATGALVASASPSKTANTGQVSLYEGLDDGWLQRIVINAEDSGDIFGSSMGLSRDGTTLIVGAKGNIELQVASGSVFVYVAA